MIDVVEKKQRKQLKERDSIEEKQMIGG